MLLWYLKTMKPGAWLRVEPLSRVSQWEAGGVVQGWSPCEELGHSKNFISSTM